MQQAHLLNETFRFEHKLKWFTAFVRKVEGTIATAEMASAVVSSLLPTIDSSRLQHAVQVLRKVTQCLLAKSKRHKRGDVWFDPWLPEYACVAQRSKLNVTRVEMRVVLRMAGSARYIFCHLESVCLVPCRQHTIVYTVQIWIWIWKRSFQRLLLQRYAKLKLVKRAAHALIKSELSQDTVNKNAIPGGGTTDVGLHTRGRAQDTCWPVVQAAIARNLCGELGLFRKIMVAIKMNTLEEVVSGIERDLGHIGGKDGCA
ncbi:hypothetical protein PsorP6_010701 [Peronosclerospora sorghi]|uniref:Uncharacterized protein n=1 Tax=Peronosclerospora sorghi TaxID=230839 RepID=A0ACC0VUF1_9STRA|nr:hypothetical protein PsorP6_010701 [Peronosclerospora sorghi]